MLPDNLQALLLIGLNVRLRYANRTYGLGNVIIPIGIAQWLAAISLLAWITVFGWKLVRSL